MELRTHILIGKNLILKIDQIMSANLAAKTSEDKPCIKITLLDGTVWSVFANLYESQQILKSIPLFNDNYEVMCAVKKRLHQYKPGRESNLSKDLKQIIS